MTDRIEAQKLWAYMENMTPEQLEERIKQIRAERRIYKARPAKVKKASISAKEKVKGMLDGLSPAEIEQLMKDLEG